MGERNISLTRSHINCATWKLTVLHDAESHVSGRVMLTKFLMG